jgi:hypothetical protein
LQHDFRIEIKISDESQLKEKSVSIYQPQALDAFCLLLSAPCSLLSALCSLLSALCFLLSALCSLPPALCPLLSGVSYLHLLEHVLRKVHGFHKNLLHFSIFPLKQRYFEGYSVGLYLSLYFL